MSVEANNHRVNEWRKTPRITIIPPVKRDQASELGPITQRFFVEGDEQAANGYKNLGIDSSGGIGVDDTRGDGSARPRVRDRELEFDSFDEVPKRQRPLVGVALVISGIAVMVAAWMVSTTGAPWRWVATQNFAAPAIAASPLPAPALAHQTAVIEPILAAPQPAPRASHQAANKQAASEAAPLAARIVPRAVPDDHADPAEADDREAADPDVRASHRARPMRGYVWSPAARAMVPAESSGSAIVADEAEPTPARAASSTQFSATATTAPRSPAAAPAPAVAPAPSLGALPAGPGIAPANTGPPPFESARVPVPAERAPIIE